ncbi:uncharacterized protein LOC130951785 isoform X3 [Arachis stenosperma]|uniref:uncharacterized protein LOC130951785 isoform X3 n=1 Tax=Arachis stenosperma TaxID=217475 RepID=UPI0025AD5345|nr:uncharacterized protein LOC130951785 isoform X3 [Arachis stenosperma]
MLPIVVSALGIVLSALTIIEKVNSWTVVGIGGFTVRGLRVVDFTILFSSKCKITWRILIGVAMEYVIRQPIPEVVEDLCECYFGPSFELLSHDKIEH